MCPTQTLLEQSITVEVPQTLLPQASQQCSVHCTMACGTAPPPPLPCPLLPVGHHPTCPLQSAEQHAAAAGTGPLPSGQQKMQLPRQRRPSRLPMQRMLRSSWALAPAARDVGDEQRCVCVCVCVCAPLSGVALTSGLCERHLPAQARQGSRPTSRPHCGGRRHCWCWLVNATQWGLPV